MDTSEGVNQKQVWLIMKQLGQKWMTKKSTLHNPITLKGMEAIIGILGKLYKSIRLVTIIGRVPRSHYVKQIIYSVWRHKEILQKLSSILVKNRNLRDDGTWNTWQVCSDTCQVTIFLCEITSKIFDYCLSEQGCDMVKLNAIPGIQYYPLAIPLTKMFVPFQQETAIHLVL